MTTTKIKKGRPTQYCKQLALEICDTISSTSKGIKLLCKNNQHWPCQDTIFTWLKVYPEFSEQYARAKKCQVDVLVDELLEIADDSTQDQEINDQGITVFNSEKVARSRLRIDTRKWLACKLVPRVYGNKVEDSPEINSKVKEDLLKLKEKLDAKYIKDY